MSEQDETIANLNRSLKSERSKAKKARERAEAAEAKVEALEYQLRDDVIGWATPREWAENDMPLPRIELHWSRIDNYNAEAVLLLVYRHFLDGCGDKRHIEAMVMGRTKRSGSDRGFHDFRGGLDAPFRDGAHAVHNAKHLGMPLYITTEDGDVTLVGADLRDQTWVRRAEK